MVKQWGFVHVPQSTFSSAMRMEFLIGYPFVVLVPPVVDLPVDYTYFRNALGDVTPEVEFARAIQEVVTYDGLDYLKDYIF